MDPTTGAHDTGRDIEKAVAQARPRQVENGSGDT
jgi:hypothetical protein